MTGEVGFVMRRSRCSIAVVLLLAGILAPRWTTAADNDSSYATSELTASTGAAWSPAAPVSGSRPWETAVRLPGRIVSMPFVALGILTNHTVLFAQNTHALDGVIGVVDRARTLGFEVAPASLGDHAGLGGAVSWAPPRLDRRLLFELSGTLSQYHRERVTAFVGPVGAVYTADWRPRELYFGRGLATETSGISNYAARSRAAKLVLAWGWQRPDSVKVRPSGPLMFNDGIRVRGPKHLTWVSAWAGPRTLSIGEGRDPKAPSFETVHPGEAAGSLDRSVEHFAYGVGVSHDARSGRPHWSSGWRASVEAQRYDKPLRGLELGDAQGEARSFSRLIYRAEAGKSLGRDPRTLRLSLVAVDQQFDRSGGTYLLADLQTLGGGAGLSGFESGRFRDVDLALAKLSYIFPLVKNLEFDMHAETGGVYPGLTLARVSTLQTSAGAALRIRGDDAMIGAIGCDWSRETARIWFALGGIE